MRPALVAFYSACALFVTPVAVADTPTPLGARTTTAVSESQTVSSVGWTPERVYGPDRYGTAAALARSWAPGVGVVYVVTGQDYPDAVAAAAGAGRVDAPVLLTTKQTLPRATRDALNRLKPSRVVVVGGPSSVSGTVLQGLRPYATSGRVERVSGPDRYATAALLAASYPKHPDQVILASGENYPDALAGAALAGHRGIPLLLTRHGALDKVTLDQLRRLSAREVVVLGGSVTVSDKVVETARATTTSRSARRLAGKDRYQTAALVAEEFPAGVSPAYVASGQTFPDALVGSAAAARRGVPLVLTPNATIHPSSRRALEHHQPAAMYVLGGSSAIRDTTVDALAGSAPVEGATYDNGLPKQVFSADSFWYQPLPDDTPVDPTSERKRDFLIQEGIDHWGNKERRYPSWTINTTQYSPPIYVTRNTDPVVDVQWNNCQGKSYDEPGLRRQLRGLHIPADAVPAAGTDQEVVFYNADEDVYTDLWVADKRPDGSWSACWGTTIPDASTSNGTAPRPYGTIASGTAVEAGTIKAEEFEDEEITHAIGMAVTVDAINSYISDPAVRSDGKSKLPHTLSMGQRLRLPANLDLDTYNFNTATRTFAEGVQNYGLIVWDRAGALSFRAENPRGMDVNPYPALFGGRGGHDVLWGYGGHDPFPWEELEVLPVDYMVAP